MHKTKAILALMALFVFTLFTASAWAAQERIQLKGQPWERVRGEAMIVDTGSLPGEKQLSLDASGLEPNAIYSVWLVNDKPALDMTGAGPQDHYFKSDGSGNGHYTANLSEYQITNWDKLEVALHPDGNPANVSNAVIALTGDLTHTTR